MTSALDTPPVTRFQTSGEEAGTAPGDRRFRPDVEGLRAVAVLLVVLFHAGMPGISGGYVGVDVFFVISGFVITGVLLRERASSGKTSILAFYGRRCRRIIPAATLVIIVTVVAAYLFIGVISGNQTAVDGRWAAVFLANFHFTAVGTNYLSSQQPPSPLQNYWSLAVEEQFYLVYPTVFLLIAAIRSRLSLQARLAVALTMVATASFLVSVIQTTTNPTVAYFSPFTRAWELALGALVAVGTRWLLTIPHLIASVMTWIGLGAIGFAAVAFTASTPYPGSLVAVPVIGAALVIAGGVAKPVGAAESLLGLPPFRWLGRLSYSMYLWHWPILIIAAEAAGKASLPFRQNAVWLLVALAASVATYHLVENPIRHAVFPRAGRWVAIGLGIVLVAASVGVATGELQAHAGSVSRLRAAPIAASGTTALAATEKVVQAAPRIDKIPADLTPSVAGASSDWGGPGGACWPSIGQTSIPTCEFGDPHGTHTLVLYGDSHAGMWLDAVSDVAIKAHWKVAYLGKGDCPAIDLPYRNPPGLGAAGSEYSVCDRWHRFAMDRINRLHPDLVLITEVTRAKPDGSIYTPQQWGLGMATTIAQMQVPKNRVVVLSNIPIDSSLGPQCLARHSNPQQCSGPIPQGTRTFNQAEQTAANDVGASYIDAIPWFCSNVCTSIIGHYGVYFDQGHITLTYAIFLEPVLAEALNLTSIK